MPHLNAASAISRAESLAKAILSGVDVAFSLAPRPPVARPGLSAGELLVSLARKGVAVDEPPGLVIKRIRADTSRRLKETREGLNGAFDAARWLHDAAAHIENGVALPRKPDMIPDEVFFAVKSVRIHHRAGIVDGLTAAARLRDAASRATLDLADARQKFLRFFSVANVAALKGAASLYDDSGHSGAAAAMRDRAEKALVAHRKFFGGEKPPRAPQSDRSATTRARRAAR